jgi:hypothetical protein
MDLSRPSDEYIAEGTRMKHLGDSLKGVQKGVTYCKGLLEYLKAIVVLEGERKRRPVESKKFVALCESTRDFAKRQASPGGVGDPTSGDSTVLVLASLFMKAEAMLDNTLYLFKFDQARSLHKTLYQDFRLLEHNGTFREDAASPKEKATVSVDRDLLMSTLTYLKINDLQVKGNERWNQSKTIPNLPLAAFDRATDVVGRISFSSSSLEDLIKFSTVVLESFPSSAPPQK